ncbi:MAG: phosphate ABC transporter ATP-binding protein [Spirochaetales bacterium]|nr:phosphate ABC transporter ATP-binding protein [Spirochaetales bacterium]
MVVKIQVNNLNCWFKNTQVIKSLFLSILEHEILGIIGPANSGKTTFLRCLNRLNDLNPHFKSKGEILKDGRNINTIKLETLRQEIGMVFAMPISLPMSIYDNITYGAKQHGIKNKKELSGIVEESLVKASLWDEVKGRLDQPALQLSGGQQQRLCIARTLAVQPEVILFDEPCSGLDPISTAKVEETMINLKDKYTIVLVTNNVKQAARVSSRIAFFLMGELVEIDTANDIFVKPSDRRTEDYITGRFG